MEVFIGTVLPFAFNFAPRGWATCQGQIMSIAQNTALFSLLGTTYGGDGKTTFGLPNLQGRSVLGQGRSTLGTTYIMGEIAGTETVTLTTAQMPMHTHAASASIAIPVYSESGNTSNANGNHFATNTAVNQFTSEAPDLTMASFNAPATVQVAGGSQPFSIMNPYLVMNYCIALYGIFPSRD